MMGQDSAPDSDIDLYTMPFRSRAKGPAQHQTDDLSLWRNSIQREIVKRRRLMMLLVRDGRPSENKTWHNLATKLLLAVGTSIEERKAGTYIATYMFCPLDPIEIVSYIFAAKRYGFTLNNGDCVRSSLRHRGQEEIISIIQNPANHRGLLGCLLKGSGGIGPSFPREVSFETRQHYLVAGPTYLQLTKKTWDKHEELRVSRYSPLGVTIGPVDLPKKLRKRCLPRNEESPRKKFKTNDPCSSNAPSSMATQASSDIRAPSPAKPSDHKRSQASTIQEKDADATTLTPELASTTSAKLSLMRPSWNFQRSLSNNDAHEGIFRRLSALSAGHGETTVLDSTPQPMPSIDAVSRPPLLPFPAQASTQPPESASPFYTPTQKLATVEDVPQAPAQSAASTPDSSVATKTPTTRAHQHQVVTESTVSVSPIVPQDDQISGLQVLGESQEKLAYQTASDKIKSKYDALIKRMDTNRSEVNVHIQSQLDSLVQANKIKASEETDIRKAALEAAGKKAHWSDYDSALREAKAVVDTMVINIQKDAGTKNAVEDWRKKLEKNAALSKEIIEDLLNL